MHDRHRSHRAAAAAAAGILAALLTSVAGGGAFAAQPAYTDPSASPSPSVSEPSPSTSPSADPSQSPSPDPTESPEPRYDMSITGGTFHGHVGEIVTVTVTIDAADERSAYTLGVPLEYHGVSYVGRCDVRDEAQNSCVIGYDTDGGVEARTLRFRIDRSGESPVPVNLVGQSAPDPDTSNNRAYVVITTTPAVPRDMRVTARDVTGKVGDTITVEVTIHHADEQSYYLVFPLTMGPKYVGDCLIEDADLCINRFDRHTSDTRIHRLRFTITTLGPALIAFWISPLEYEDPNGTNNYGSATITGTPAPSGSSSGGGGGGGGGGGDGADSLPLTGAPAAALIAGGAGLLGAGSLLVVAARRRRAEIPPEAP